MFNNKLFNFGSDACHDADPGILKTFYHCGICTIVQIRLITLRSCQIFMKFMERCDAQLATNRFSADPDHNPNPGI